MSQENRSISLDSFDIAILRILQSDATISHRLIGQDINLSAPSVQRRIKRMEQSGVIARQVAIIDPAKVGLPLTIVVEVEMKVETGGQIDDTKQAFLQAPQVQQCYYVTGETDFVLIVVVGDMAEYEKLTQELFFSNENIRKFKSFVVMDRTKAATALNL